MLPLLLQLRYESDEPLVFPQTIQVGIVLKQGVAREAVVGGELQPFNCQLRFIEQRICRRNVEGRVMKMLETFSDLNRACEFQKRMRLRGANSVFFHKSRCDCVQKSMRPVLEYTKVVATSFVREQDRL